MLPVTRFSMKGSKRVYIGLKDVYSTKRDPVASSN